MPWQFGRHITRPFQALFYSMEYFYEESKGLYDKVHAQVPSKPEEFDQHLWMKEKASSRACLISGMAAVEAFANTALRDFSVRGKSDLPEQMLNWRQKKSQIDRWRLIDKVYCLPTLCNRHLTPPACFFKKDSQAFRTFAELIEIRNSIMHGRPQAALTLFKLKKNKKHEASTEFDVNFWPVTQIPKDLSSFNHECATIARSNIIWVRDSLVTFLEKVDKNYLREEKIKLISPVIPESRVTEDELRRSWKQYVTYRDSL